MFEIISIGNTLSGKQSFNMAFGDKAVEISVPAELLKVQRGDVLQGKVLERIDGNHMLVRVQLPSAAGGQGQVQATLPMEVRLPMTPGNEIQLRITENNLSQFLPNNAGSAQVRSPNAGNSPLPVIGAQVTHVAGAPVQSQTAAVDVNVSSQNAQNVGSGQATQSQPPDARVQLLLPMQANGAEAGQAATRVMPTASQAPSAQGLLSQVESTVDVSQVRLNTGQPIEASLVQGKAFSVSQSSAGRQMLVGDQPLNVTVRQLLPASTAQTTFADPTVIATQNAPAGQGNTVAGGQNFSMQAVVVQADANGMVQLSTPAGTLQLKLPEPLPLQTRLNVDLQATSVQAGQVQSSAAKLPVSNNSAQYFPPDMQALASDTEAALRAIMVAVDEAFKLDGFNPLQQRIMPAVDKQLAARALWFMGNLAQGGSEQWLGADVMQRLQSSRFGGEVDALKQVFSRWSQILADRGAPQASQAQTGWQTLPMAVHDGAQAHVIPLHVRHEQNGEREGEKYSRKNAKTSHFMVQLELEQLGALQLDGVVNFPELEAKERSAMGRVEFFLTIMSEERMSLEMRQDILAMFDGHLQSSGFKGAIRFQTDPALRTHMKEVRQVIETVHDITV